MSAARCLLGVVECGDFRIKIGFWLANRTICSGMSDIGCWDSGAGAAGGRGSDGCLFFDWEVVGSPRAMPGDCQRDYLFSPRPILMVVILRTPIAMIRGQLSIYKKVVHPNFLTLTRSRESKSRLTLLKNSWTLIYTNKHPVTTGYNHKTVVVNHVITRYSNYSSVIRLKWKSNQNT